MTVEARLEAGIYALNRFLLTVQNKRMPVSDLRAHMQEGETTVVFTFDCPEENARRYMILLENLEDVLTVGEVEKS
ncbi:Hypothetical Protein RradSPS_0220 [Rubrobacter radiotolerans]|uniref:Uncharacterized protein n=1 Tax=Rubrobacter radiotolerans TaxID=42256 RepID=A0A023WZK1_RUBRA|nr:hypothetical protein [Rubrobacter radiotolerans]AHY45503.1 Hypothetical Protein RradSPS_0220 [Rubrobacter radiotolerans]MDX5892914.1 hypothetical protein [Rubrobacter radiotolerans]SMC02738.1 conserved hypothetical protein [Rubrobacter radiotolerans DSM 5868]